MAARLSKFTLEEAAEEYSQSLVTKSPLTASAYTQSVAACIQFCAEKGVKRARSLQPKHLEAYIKELRRQKKSEATVARVICSMRSFCKWLRKEKILKVDATEDIAPAKVRTTPPRVPSEKEIEAIFAAIDVESPSGIRDRAMLELLYSSGLRASELCDLQCNHFRGACVTVICGKRGKTRTVPVSSEAALWIERYINEFQPDRHLFITLQRKKITRTLLSMTVRRYALKARVPDVTAHTLRHACATHLLDGGADLRLIQEVLGHESIATTQRYTHLSGAKMDEMFRKFHPRDSRGLS